MNRKNIAFLMVLIACTFSVRAQVITPVEYISMYKDLAIREMKRMGVPAAITLAQGLLETESGNSVLVKKSNNHFGIKCKSTWTAAGVSHDDDAPGECFRTYKDAEASYRDHSNYLRGNDRYAFLFNLSPNDYKGWARGLKTAGYATNPRYPDILIKNIEQYNLQQYSAEASGDVPKFNADDFTSDKAVATPVVPEAESIVNNAVNKEEAVTSMVDVTDKVHVINGSKCIFAKKGTSLLVIASKNNINLSKLLALNELGEDGLLGKDQIIFLEKKAKKGEKDFHIVQPGETLFDVAQKNGIQLQYLIDYNHLQEDVAPVAGTKLFLKPDIFISAGNKTGVKSSVNYHEVQPKEGLYAISKKYSISVQQLKEWNNLSSDTLSIGQHLIIAK